MPYIYGIEVPYMKLKKWDIIWHYVCHIIMALKVPYGTLVIVALTIYNMAPLYGIMALLWHLMALFMALWHLLCKFGFFDVKKKCHMRAIWHFQSVATSDVRHFKNVSVWEMYEEF